MVVFDAWSHSIHKNIILVLVGQPLDVDPQEPQIGEQRASDQLSSLIEICFQILTRSEVIMQWVHLRLRAV